MDRKHAREIDPVPEERDPALRPLIMALVDMYSPSGEQPRSLHDAKVAERDRVESSARVGRGARRTRELRGRTGRPRIVGAIGWVTAIAAVVLAGAVYALHPHGAQAPSRTGSSRAHSHALDNIGDLGKPGPDVPGTYDTLENFAKIGANFRVGHKVEFILFDTSWDNISAASRWAVVKALEQFGTWSGLREGQASLPLNYPQPGYSPGSTVPGEPPYATYDLSHARYHSPYVVFTHRVVQSKKNGPRLALPRREATVFARILRMPPVPAPEVNSPNAVAALPAVILGRYGMHGPLTVPYDLTGRDLPARFVQVQKLIQGGDRFEPGTQANLFTNVVSAFVCYQDGRVPRFVCNRGPVRNVLRRIR